MFVGGSSKVFVSAVGDCPGVDMMMEKLREI